MAESRQKRPKAPKSRQKAPKPVKHSDDDVPAYGISVHQVLGYDDKTIGVQYRVKPYSNVRVITTHEIDGAITITIYTPSGGARVV